MAITLVGHKSFAKYNVVTGAGTYNLPSEDVSTVYGPGWPITPVPRPEDSDLPREIDYPVTVNATLQPRVGYEGLMPVSALKSAYSNVVEVSTPVGLIVRELSGFVPMLKDRKTRQRVDEGHPYNWLTVSPDRSTPFNVWLSRFKKSAKVYAAPAFFMRRDNKGEIDALEYIDGSTLFLIINPRGKLPEPGEVDPELRKYVDRIKYGIANNDPRVTAGMPDIARKYLEAAKKRISEGKPMPITTPAFTQIIKGIPFSFWDKNQIYFVPEPPAPSVDSPYGESYIERSWTWIQLIALLTAFELGHYRTGNMPEGFASMPKDWFPTMTKLALAEKEFNARMASGAQTQHARIRFGPEGMKYIPTKKPDFPDKLYGMARHNIYYALGVPTSEIGERSSRGLGGKGFEQGAAHDMTRQILETEKRSVEDAFNQVLIKSGVDDVTFYLDYPQEEIDPSMQQESLWNQFIHGSMTLNDVLTAQNKHIVGSTEDNDNIANMHLIVAGNSVYVVEKMVADPSGLVAPIGAVPGQEGGSPIGPEDAIKEGKEHTPEDRATVEKVVRLLEATAGKSLSTTTWSIPSLEKAHPKDKCFNCDKPPRKDVIWAQGFGRAWFCVQHYNEFKSKRHVEAVHDIDGVAPPKWQRKADAKKADSVDPEEWRMGIEEEQEHADTVGNDQDVIANIVRDHLDEDSEYYTHLHDAMNKRYKVEHRGRDFVVVNISTGKDVPGGNHGEDKGKADAHLRALYANVPDARKVDIVHNHGDGGMVAVYIPEGAAKKLREITESLRLPINAGIEKASNMHVTLAYMPYPDPGMTDNIIRIMKKVALSYGSIDGHIQGYGIFNGQDDVHVLYATLDCPELPFIRTMVCDELDGNGVTYSREHGFVPHITLAYFSDDWQLPAGFMVPDIDVSIDGISLCIENEIRTVTFLNADQRVGKLEKVDWAEYFKHCGVCPEDEEYFNAPISRQVKFDFPVGHHANEVEIVAMAPDGKPPKPALWKPEGGESLRIQENIGGPQYVREEAAWLLAQCLGFPLVPLSYVSKVDDELGAAIWYTPGQTSPRGDLSDYSPEWVERAAVLDYIMSQRDRRERHNYMTHPDEEGRIVLIDNGFSFPDTPNKHCGSLFCEYMMDKPISQGTLDAIEMCLGDTATWRDIRDVLSTENNEANAEAAVATAKACAQRVLDNKAITSYE